MMTLGLEAGQKTPPNSPATPNEPDTSGSPQSEHLNVSLSPYNGNKGCLGSNPTTLPLNVQTDHTSHQELQNLELIRQQMILNEFVRNTGYPLDQATKVLKRFHWDYQAAISDFFDEVRVAQQSGQTNAFPPHNTPLTPPAFPSEMTLSFNHLCTESPGFGTVNNNNNHHSMSPFFQCQSTSAAAATGVPSMEPQNLSNSSSQHNFNNSFELSANFSPLAGASSPIQFHRVNSSSSFQSNIPFPMDMGVPGNSSTCSTPSSNGSLVTSGTSKSPFTFQHPAGGHQWSLGFNQVMPQSSGHFVPGGWGSNQMDYRCASEVKSSDSLESME